MLFLPPFKWPFKMGFWSCSFFICLLLWTVRFLLKYALRITVYYLHHLQFYNSFSYGFTWVHWRLSFYLIIWPTSVFALPPFSFHSKSVTPSFRSFRFFHYIFPLLFLCSLWIIPVYSRSRQLFFPVIFCSSSLFQLPSLVVEIWD